MPAIKLKSALRPPESLFVLLSRQAADTEAGRRLVVDSVHLDNDSAERLAVRDSGMREVREVPFNVGFTGSPLWAWANARVLRFGLFSQQVREAIGVSAGDHALLPDLSDEEWARYRVLAEQAGRNPLAAEFMQREADMMKFTTDTGRAKKLFAVMSPDHDIVAIFDPNTNVYEARTMFSIAVDNNPELADHRLRELYAGAGFPWGDYLTTPDTLDITEQLLGKFPDGTVFIIPGEREEYTLHGSMLLTSGGQEADLLGLVRAGLRARTMEDVRDAAYARMEHLISEARGQHA